MKAMKNEVIEAKLTAILATMGQGGLNLEDSKHINLIVKTIMKALKGE